MWRLLVLALALTSPLNAGLWDDDRPEEPPAPYDAIGGRFDEFPADYYQHRLTHALPVLNALESVDKSADGRQAERIVTAAPLFDLASVAHFRVGRFAEAIILINRKNQLLKLIEQDHTATARLHRARALANKASCLHHRWRGGDGKTAQDLQLAAEILRGLLNEDQYNADARWSLMEVEWLLGKPAYSAGADPVFPNILGLKDASFQGSLDDSAVTRNGLSGSISWLSRRISYEDGWRDVDVMYAYSLALFLAGRAEESLFAWFRVCELIEEGHATRVANAPGPKTLKRLLGVHVENTPERSAAHKLYRELREQCEHWRKSRNDYVAARLKKGEHPDTTETFWANWSLYDRRLPEAGKPETEEGVTVSRVLLLGGFGGLILVLILIFGATLVMSRKGPAPSVDEL